MLGMNLIMSNIREKAFNINNIVLLASSKLGYRYGGFTSIYFEETTGGTTYIFLIINLFSFL